MGSLLFLVPQYSHCVVFSGFLITAIVQNSDSQRHGIIDGNAALSNVNIEELGLKKWLSS